MLSFWYKSIIIIIIIIVAKEREMFGRGCILYTYENLYKMEKFRKTSQKIIFVNIAY